MTITQAAHLFEVACKLDGHADDLATGQHTDPGKLAARLYSLAEAIREAIEQQPAPAILPAVSLEALGRFERGDMCERCLRMMQETPAQREYCAACGGRA